jgi:hypothetical protein
VKENIFFFGKQIFIKTPIHHCIRHARRGERNNTKEKQKEAWTTAPKPNHPAENITEAKSAPEAKQWLQQLK